MSQPNTDVMTAVGYFRVRQNAEKYTSRLVLRFRDSAQVRAAREDSILRHHVQSSR
jgi:hypothetical protein